jgi:hypothetical protein
MYSSQKDDVCLGTVSARVVSNDLTFPPPLLSFFFSR